jgi:hypothetical protein
MGNWTARLQTLLTVLTQNPASIFDKLCVCCQRGAFVDDNAMPYTFKKTTVDMEIVITALEREAAREGCTMSELDIPDWRKPTADEIRALHT